MTDYWAKFWQEKSDPLHSGNDAAYYDLMASELQLLLPKAFASVADIGCGNGVLYERLGFAQRQYEGIDFSPAMIASFKQSHPNANARVGDARDFVPASPVDLVFSNGVIQYLSYEDIDRHLAAMTSRLSPNGVIIHAAIPWRFARWGFYSGDLQPVPRSRIRALASYVLIHLGLRPAMGDWYTMRQFRTLAARHGLSCRCLGSLYYPYRFHAVLERAK